MPFDGTTVEERSLGGSESAAYYMARALQRAGQRVTVFSNIPEPSEADGVLYRPIAEWRLWAPTTPHDVTVAQRLPELLSARVNSRLQILWMHDMAMVRTRDKVNGISWNVDKGFLLSAYMVQQYRDAYGWPESFIHQTRNGIDLAAFAGLDGIPRDRFRFVYAARPERGLDLLLEKIVPRLLEAEPRIRLAIARYDNTVEEMIPFYRHIDALMRRHRDRIDWLGSLTKEQLYREYAASGVYVYPTPGPVMPLFREISCITAMECQAAGLPIVTSHNGALPETIAAGAGELIDGDPQSDTYQDAFVDAVLRYVHDDTAWHRASRAGVEHARSLDWSGVADEWIAGFERWIAERNDSPARLVRHFWRRSDIVAARATMAEFVPADDPDRPALERLLEPWAFVAEGKFQEQYERIGQTHIDVFDQVPLEPRFSFLRKWLEAHPEVERILDFGCAHGAYAVNMANAIGRTWVGVDIDRHSIEWANRFTREHATAPDALSWYVGDHTIDLSWAVRSKGPFDLLWMGEVLEHVPEPHVVIDALEQWVKPGGLVLVTVPYGPWEHMSYDRYPHRAHLWEFDQQDLRELLAAKREVAVQVMPMGNSDRTAEPIGWHICQWTVDRDRQAQPIDMARKLRLQRPMQTLSAILMAGDGAEETLHWCLRSVRAIVDEIIVADCGLNDEGRRILAQYPGVRVVASAPPSEIGFEGPRNAALAAARMDWALWIDTDEKLLDPWNLTKFLRANIFNGYQIKQNHFAVDTAFAVDLPVRVFRRAPGPDGKAMRFFGMIHEHPEVGLNEGPGMTIVLNDVQIAHVGYLIESTRRGRFMRNTPLLEKDKHAYPERLLQKHFIMRDNMLMAGYVLGQNGGVLTPQIREWCQETIAIYRQHFLGKVPLASSDPLEYYSQALAVLHQGFDVKWGLTADKDSAPIIDGQAKRARFATVEEFERTLACRAREIAGAFEHEYW